MGGAAAGFLIIYGALYYSYSGLAKSALDDSKNQLAVCQAALKTSADNDEEVGIKGVVDPALKNAQIVFAIRIFPLRTTALSAFPPGAATSRAMTRRLS